MILKEKLKPCPFCGSSEFTFIEEYSKNKTMKWYTIIHLASNPCSISMLESNKESLIKKWNTRK